MTYRYGGEGGIRTHEPGFARLPAFEAGSFNRSDTSPERKFSGGSLFRQSAPRYLRAAKKLCIACAHSSRSTPWRTSTRWLSAGWLKISKHVCTAPPLGSSQP